MLQKFSVGLLVLFISLWTGAANATFTFSNVSYTANSVTFTIDGDMSGYQPPTYRETQFSLIYGGDIWAENPPLIVSNIWSKPVFDNQTLKSFNITATWGNNFSFSTYTSSLENATASQNTVTLSFDENALEPDESPPESILNIGASSPAISFVWGWAAATLGVNTSCLIPLHQPQRKR
jgi:hypothetical protein